MACFGDHFCHAQQISLSTTPVNGICVISQSLSLTPTGITVAIDNVVFFHVDVGSSLVVSQNGAIVVEAGEHQPSV